MAPAADTTGGLSISEYLDVLDVIEQSIAQRTKARNEGDYKTADIIRDVLADNGIALMDKPGGTDWREQLPSRR